MKQVLKGYLVVEQQGKPAYSPELNPAEKMWQWFKDRIAMKIFKSIETLEDKVTQLINELENQKIIQITAYEYLISAYYSVFN